MNKVYIKDFAASRGAWVACLGLVAFLSVSLAGLAWVQRTSTGPLSNFRVQFDTVRGMESRWDTEILLLQLGIAPNYDAVTTAGHDLKVSLKRLHDTVAEQKSLTPLQESFNAYADMVARKDWLSEQVKASYAMLRNAVTVLPTALADSFGQSDVLQLVPGTNKRMSDLVTEVVTAMVSFTTSPTARLRDTVQTRIDAARAAEQSFSTALKESVERYLVQSEVAIGARQHGNELMLMLTAVPTNAAAIRVQATLQSLEVTSATLQRVFWYLMASLCGLLVITFTALIFALKFRFAKFAKDNLMLQQVNQDVEEKLLQSAKLSALGQMVAGITHEINTPLAYVRAVFEMIKERVLAEPELMAGGLHGDDDIMRERREEMQMLIEDGLHGLTEMATLVRTMRNFSRMDKGQIEPFSVEEGIESALLIARPQLKYIADVKREFDSVPDIMGSPSQLRQVLLNLIVNATEAMSEMGRRGVLTLRTRITSSDTVEIDVCDNGPGMSEEVMGKIFDPFYTTKPVGKGTGMGLSICYRIIENHGGTITVNSKPGRNTIFTLTLPRQDEKYPTTPNARSDNAPAALPA